MICEEIELYTEPEDVKQVAEMTPGYVGADLNLLCREALYLSLVIRSVFNPLKISDFK
jgi:SpoVK/Ycf46/Vps4 family AAA+-type ATPase